MATRPRVRNSFLLASLGIAFVLLLAPGVADAKRLPVVTASFEGAPDSVPVGATRSFRPASRT